jgi:hypothetical protein
MTPCLGCIKPVETTTTVHTYFHGNEERREVVQVRYCAKCRAEFEAEFRPAGGHTPAIPTPAGSSIPQEVK